MNNDLFNYYISELQLLVITWRAVSGSFSLISLFICYHSKQLYIQLLSFRIAAPRHRMRSHFFFLTLRATIVSQLIISTDY